MALFRVDFQGTLHGIETFQHGHHLSSTDTSAGVASDAAVAWGAILSSGDFAGNFTTGINWAQVTVSELGATPADPIVTSAISLIGDAGTSEFASLPAQCSPCISLTTSTAGSRGRGRMYLPPTDTQSVGSSGRLNSTPRAEILAGVETYLESWDANAGTVVVVSGVGGVWTARNVISARLGDVVDTQRSRRNSIAETYAVAPI